MDIATFPGLGTLLLLGAFICILLWAYGDKRKAAFAAAALLPFANQALVLAPAQKAFRSNNV